MGVKLLFIILFPLLAVLLFLLVIHFLSLRRRTEKEPEEEPEKLVTFPGGESLTVHSILDAPGEVVGKSSHSTLYKAIISRERNSSPTLLRFLRPASASRPIEILPAARLLGLIRHPNLTPLLALYVGPRGENLLVLPFYLTSLHRFLKDSAPASFDWKLILKISLGIANGLGHLHNGLSRPVLHGNLKTKNVLLDSDHSPHLSDFSLHLLLNPSAAQELLEASAAEGFKPPELLKAKDISKESDIFSLGVIFLEMVTRRENGNFQWSKEMISPEILNGRVERERVFAFFRLGMSCCSPSPFLRPAIDDVIKKLGDMGERK